MTNTALARPAEPASATRALAALVVAVMTIPATKGRTSRTRGRIRAGVKSMVVAPPAGLGLATRLPRMEVERRGKVVAVVSP